MVAAMDVIAVSIFVMCNYVRTVGPLYKGHIGTSKFVHCREVVHSSEVENVLALYESLFWCLRKCPL